MQNDIARDVLTQLTDQIGRVVYGAEEHTRLAFLAMLVRGH